MAITNLKIRQLVPLLDLIPSNSGGTQDNAQTMMIVTADVTSSSGGDVTAAKLGLVSIEGGIGGANVTVSTSANKITFPDTTATGYAALVVGQSANVRTLS